jgi:hypothetical protein
MPQNYPLTTPKEVVGGIMFHKKNRSVGSGFGVFVECRQSKNTWEL